MAKPWWIAGAVRYRRRRPVAPQQHNAGERAERDGAELAGGGRHRKHQGRRDDRKRRPRLAGRHGARHAPHRLGDHGDRRDLEAVQPGGVDRAEVLDAERKQHQRDGRGQGEPGPGGERAGKPGAGQADADADLAARRTRQELAQRHEVGIGRLVEPAAALDELLPKVAEMRDRSAERGEPEPQEGDEDFAPRRPCPELAHRLHVRSSARARFGRSQGCLLARSALPRAKRPDRARAGADLGSSRCHLGRA